MLVLVVFQPIGGRHHSLALLPRAAAAFVHSGAVDTLCQKVAATSLLTTCRPEAGAIVWRFGAIVGFLSAIVGRLSALVRNLCAILRCYWGLLLL